MTMQETRFIVGIDLGTTNIAVTFIDTEKDTTKIKKFSIPQLYAPGELKENDLLPAFHFSPEKSNVASGSLQLPWNNEIDYSTGLYARDYGSNNPTRFISSSKSWLCHSGVNRREKILPWNSDKSERKFSPVEITKSYLEHIRAAWDYKFKNVKDVNGESCDLTSQQIIITVPASFDETARELTIEAAELCGFKNITLLEEPLSVFYSWLNQHENSWREIIQPGEKTLVIDIGGGTTDFSIIELSDTGTLSRSVAGEHLLLGGDNIDIAISKKIETEWKTKLNASDWTTLCQLSRKAKEELLSNQNIEESEITLLSKGSSLIGNMRKSVLKRSELNQLIDAGFFPKIDADSESAKKKTGIQTMGLPYASDPAATRHLLDFLKYAGSISGKESKERTPLTNSKERTPLTNTPSKERTPLTNSAGTKEKERTPLTNKYAGSISGKENKERTPLTNIPEKERTPLTPDKVLFNGGSMIPEYIRQHTLECIQNWFPEKEISELESMDLSLAVAYGASYYGKTRRGEGVKVKSGTARSYYIEVDSNNERRYICVMPRATDESIRMHTNRQFTLQANHAVSFPMYSSSVRVGDEAGDILETKEELSPVSNLINIMKFGQSEKQFIDCELTSELTETGVLKVYVESKQSNHCWPLNFDTRILADNTADTTEQFTVDSHKVENALKMIREKLINNSEKLPSLIKNIEKELDLKRKDWSIHTLRQLADALLEIPYDDMKSAKQEVRWLNLCGFSLRPGFGDPADELRLKKVWKIWFKGINNKKNPQVVAEWWVFWRRVSSGLRSGHQRTIFEDLLKQTCPKGQYAQKIKSGEQSKAEMWRCIGSLELIAQDRKIAAGKTLIGRVQKLSDYEFWTLARLGARRMFRAPANNVISSSLAEKWLSKLISNSKNVQDIQLFTISRIAALSGDRNLDIHDDRIKEVKEFLKSNDAPDLWVHHLENNDQESREEQAKIIGDSLPLGLQLNEVL